MPILDGGGPSGLPAPETGQNAVSTILNLCDQQLQDVTGKKWGPTKLIPYLNLGIIEIINLKPEAYATTVDLTLVEGPVQKLPDAYFALVDVICNLTGVGSNTPGQTITFLKKEILDHVLPGWMSYPSAATVSHVVLDSREPKKAYVFPPQPAGQTNKIRTLMSVAPTEIADADGTFPLDDSYKPAAVDYVVYRALAEETTVPNALAKSTMFWNKFLQDLGLKTNVEDSPKRAEK